MVELYTSRWANRELARLDCQPVSISRGDKSGVPFSYRKVWDLAPSRETFALQDAEEARTIYLQGLDEIGVERISDALERIADDAGRLPLVLLCHEDVLEGQDCHRRWYAEWWLEQTGEHIPELAPGDLPDADGVAQPRLL